MWREKKNQDQWVKSLTCSFQTLCHSLSEEQHILKNAGQVRNAALFCDLVLFIMFNIWLSLHTCLLGCEAFFSTARCILFLAFSQAPHGNYTSQVGQCQLGFPTALNKCLCFVALTLLHVENGYSKIKRKENEKWGRRQFLLWCLFF